MRIPWFRRDFLVRRWLDRLFLDAPDFVARALTGRSHWPPYSLRSYVGGAHAFDQVGRWFLEEFRTRGFFLPNTRILDIGCGCGRLAYALATDAAVRDLQIVYTGMDVDRASIAWCQRNVTPQNAHFSFYHADCYNPSYNPRGRFAAVDYRFPHPDASFQLILLTSVLTHVLEEELLHYIEEVARLLAPQGVAFVTFFLYETSQEAASGIARHGIAFPFARGHGAVNREDYPTNAVAYEEAFVRQLVQQAGLRVIEPTHYGVQDLLLLTRAA
jgi:SAM-dependent methyltransferase